MNSSNSVSGASPSVAPPTGSFNVLLADGSRLRVNCRDLATQLRQERNAALKRLRQTRAEALADVADRIGEARIRREFQANERKMDAAIRRLSKQVRVRPERRRSSSQARSPRSNRAVIRHHGVELNRSTRSALARRDRLGREGIMLRIRYVRAGGKHASSGCLRRHYRYIAREAAVMRDDDGTPILLGNLGDTIDEVADALGLQEQVLRAMRKNAKLGFRMVGAFPYGLPTDARREILQRIGDEVFGARGLPWTAAAHNSDPGGEVDNPHFHLDYGLLPMQRQADGSFIISNDLRTDLDGQEGLRFIRHSVARVMTEVAMAYSLDRRFTALSYRERGMDREGGEHVGQEGTAAHRRGEHVASIARNEANQRRAEAQEKARRARKRLEALKRLKQALTSVTAAPHVTTGPSEISEGAVFRLPVGRATADEITLIEGLATGPVPSLSAINFMPTMISAEQAPRVSACPTLSAVPATAMPSLELPSSFLDDGAIAAVPEATPPITVEVDHAEQAMLTLPPGTAPSIDSFEGRIFAEVDNAPLIGVAPPSVVAPADAPGEAAKLPTVAAIGSYMPAPIAVPTVDEVGSPAPRTAAANLPRIYTLLAPPIDAVPALAETGDAVPLMTVPPMISRIGGYVRRLPTIAPTAWSIGRELAADAADQDIEKRLKEVLELEEARRRIANDRDAAQRDGHAARAAAFEALRLRDEWLGRDERGHYTVSDDALRESGLSGADLDTPAAQEALERIGLEQVDRLDPVLADQGGRPPFDVGQGVIRLDDRFSKRLRDDVARWSSSPHFRAFVGRVWPQLREALQSMSAVPANSEMEPEEHGGRSLTALFSAIAQERHYLAKEHGVPVIGRALLERFGLAHADIAGDDARKRIAALAEQQASEIARIAVHVRNSPQDVVPDGNGWLLNETAPKDVRMLVAAWRNDATVQRALGQVVEKRAADALQRDSQPTPEHPGLAWRRARALRERAMAKGDLAERCNPSGLTQPGGRIARPGTENIGDTTSIARRFPIQLSHGIDR